MAFTHFDDDGNQRMVDVSDKGVTERIAVAEGRISVSREVFDAVEGRGVKKGDVISVSVTAGIMAAKRTFEIIPMCHVLPLTHVSVTYEKDGKKLEYACKATVKTVSRTGVEMEALTAVFASLLTFYDMCKAIDKSMVISGIRLLEKHGGKSGDVCFA